MAGKINLYDMEHGPPGREGWRRFGRGDHWRSQQIYKCEVCHAETNYWIIGGWPGMGPRLLCPAQAKYIDRHGILEEKLSEYLNIEGKIKFYKAQISGKSGKADNLLAALYEERGILDGYIAKTRSELFRTKNVRGVDADKAEAINFYPSSKVAR